jgi:hypothetical protein
MKTPLSVLATIAACGLATAALAQGPRGSADTTIEGRKISVDYGRPSLKGRELADLLKQLRPERIWRAGENQVTTLATDGDITVGGQRVSAGKYSVYVHAGEDGKWSLILNRDLGQPLGKIWDKAPESMKSEPWPYLGDYEKSIRAQEVVRVDMTPSQIDGPTDPFTISFAPRVKGADLVLAWGKEAWSVGVAPAK